MKKFFCILAGFAFCFALISCDWLNDVIYPDEEESANAAEILISGGAVDVSGVGLNNNFSGLIFALELKNLEFNSDAQAVLTEGYKLDADTGSALWAKFEVAEPVVEGDTKLIVKASGTLREESLDFTLKVNKNWLNTSSSDVAYADEKAYIAVSGKLASASSSSAKAQIVLASSENIYLSSSLAPIDMEVPVYLVNARFTEDAARALKANANLKSISGVVDYTAPEWLGITVKEDVAASSRSMVLRFSGTPTARSGAGKFGITFDSGWFESVSADVSGLENRRFEFNVAQEPEGDAYSISPSSGTMIIKQASARCEKAASFVLRNIVFSNAAAEVLKRNSDLASDIHVVVRKTDSDSDAAVPDWITFKVAEDVVAGGNELKINVSAVPPDLNEVRFELTLKKEWLRRARTSVREITDDLKVEYALSQRAGTHDNTAVSTGEPAVPKKDAGSGKQANLSDLNAMEIRPGQTSLPMEAHLCQNLYTIAVNYPEGDYTGETLADFVLKGSGGNTDISSYSALAAKGELKDTPHGEGNWNDMWDMNSIGAAEIQTTGRYWFTDTNNLIKYYITTGDNRRDETTGKMVNGAYEGVGIYNNVDSDYWMKLEAGLRNGFLKDADMLKGERDAFGLSEYDRDRTSYFYVIVCDFGEGSANVNGRAYSGTSGVYSSIHIRPGEYSNCADIFYINARFIESFVRAAKNTDANARMDSILATAADNAVSTLLHEYMHYLMDANHLLLAEEEFSDFIDPETETIFDSDGNLPIPYGTTRTDARIRMYSGMNYGSLFWIEGTANYAPYRMIGESDKSAVKSWLGNMSSWRPSICDSDNRSASAGNTYSVYGAGGLFFSYVAEKYGKGTINRFHSWRDTGADIKRAIANLPEASHESAIRDYVGNIKTITKGVLGEDFKDVYLNFLYQCMSSMSDSVTIKGCVRDFNAPEDWGFAAGLKDLMLDSLSDYVVSRNSVTSGITATNIPELSFVINKWNAVPQSFDLSVTKGNVKCYAIWF